MDDASVLIQIQKPLEKRLAHRPATATPLENRLLAMRRFLVKLALGDNGCIEWTGSRQRQGYGVFYIGHDAYVMAHRRAWEWSNGKDVPEGMLVCHSCDNPPCCNPDHLFLGTPADNMADMVNKGRSSRGEKQHKSRLNEQTVLDVLRWSSQGCTLSQIARILGVSISAVRLVIAGKSWRHVHRGNFESHSRKRSRGRDGRYINEPFPSHQ